MKPESFPEFDHTVPESGYQWWYVDGTSNDGEHHLVVIAFVGSVFSPYYFRAIGAGRGDPEQYCALNVGLYSRGQRRWVLSEYNATRIQRERHAFALGNSSLRYDGTALQIDVDDRAVPVPRRVRGRIRIEPRCQTAKPYELHAQGRQLWWPFAPSSAVEVDMNMPSLRWRGHGYFDTNSGAVPLQDCFRDWHWSRQHYDNATHVTYQTRDTQGETSELALRIGDDGSIHDTVLPPVRSLPRGLWRMQRPIATQHPASVAWTLEDAPFYTRSVIAVDDGTSALTMHESLSLEQFVKPWVQRLLPFRTRRDVKDPR